MIKRASLLGGYNMTQYMKNDNAFFIADDLKGHLIDELPAGNYIIQATPQGELFFLSVDNFKPIEKVYGNATRYAERILNTFNDRSASTGVLLMGEKGSGKTLLSRLISLNSNLPTIIINSPWCGDAFNKLIQDVDQPAIVLFDEFEKIYEQDKQEKILTLLDGVFPTKKLFIFTCNNKYKIDENMKNRPGRIFYAIEYKGVGIDFIKEYCEDKLDNKAYIDDIVKLSELFDNFNFDMLQALVQDMNRYHESPTQVLDLLNAKPSLRNSSDTYEPRIFVNDKEMIPYKKSYHCNTSQKFEIGYYQTEEDKKKDENDEWLNVEPRDLVEYKASQGIYKYEFKEEDVTYRVILKKDKKDALDIFRLL